MASPQQRADAILNSKRKGPAGHACYPCSKRKVKCEGGQPCEQCLKRKHGHICFYHDGKRPAARSRRHQQASDERASAFEAVTDLTATGSSNPSNGSTPSLSVRPDESGLSNGRHESPELASGRERGRNTRDSQESQAGRKTQIGRYSLAALLQQKLSSTAIDVRSSFGLVNDPMHDPTHDPMLELYSSPDHSDDFLGLCIKRSEVLEFFPIFQQQIAPFYPILEDSSAFQVLIFDVLDRLEKLQADSNDLSQLRAFLQASSANLALAFIVLALGCQFSYLSASDRLRQGQDFAQRSEAFLRLSNYVVKPSVQTVQALLYTGIYMQNIGQSDGAWSLLGLTLRIAQSLGLCKDDSQGERSLWNHVLWQDSLLSLRFDRLPIRSGSALILDTGNAGSREADSYATTMLRMNHITLSFLSTPRPQRIERDTVVGRLEQVREVLNSTVSYLRSEERCRTLQQRLENLVLRVHSSFLKAEISRPYLAIVSHDDQEPEDASMWLRNTCMQSMGDVVQAYLDMAKMSILPLRSWSLIHEALTCSCVLALLRPTSIDSSVNIALNNMQLLLERELQPDIGTPPLGTVGFISRGVKLLKFLREHGPEIIRAATAVQESTADQSNMTAPEAGLLYAAVEDNVGNYNSTTMSREPLVPIDSGVDQTWWEPFLMDIGLDSSLSSFLDVSTDFFQ